MSREVINCAVMFADVAGSTALYDNFGDSKAKAAIEDCINRMAGITVDHNGIVIKTIGDEIMCRFSTENEGVNACCAIQEAMQTPVGPDKMTLAIRIGIHAGEAILQDNDVFGDAVNMAARMAGIAKADQIITTEDTYNQLSTELQEKSRQFDITEVKGKQARITIYDVMWNEDDDVTRMAYSSAQTATDTTLVLGYNGEDSVLTESRSPLTLGRGSKANMVIDTTLASRIHAKIEYNRGKFVLVDQSTNGTYVKLADGKEIYLRREELPLSSKGLICLGGKVDESGAQIISFSVS